MINEKTDIYYLCMCLSLITHITYKITFQYMTSSRHSLPKENDMPTNIFTTDRTTFVQRGAGFNKNWNVLLVSLKPSKGAVCLFLLS